MHDSPRPGGETPSFGNLAASVVSDVTSMLPDLGMSMLVPTVAQVGAAILRSRAARAADARRGA